MDNIQDLNDATRIICEMYITIEMKKHPHESEQSIGKRFKQKAVDTLEEAMNERGVCRKSPESGLSIEDHKQYKGLPPEEDLFDHMTLLELMLTNFYQCLILQFHRERDSHGFQELLRDCIDAGRVAGRVREIIEQETGYTILSSSNNLSS